MLELKSILFSRDLNYLQLLFLSFGFSLSLVGIFVNWFDKYLPSFLLNSFRYGKLSGKKRGFGMDYVPKGWFRHFYVFASIFSLFSSILLILLYFNYIHGIQEQLQIYLSFVVGPSSKPTSVSADASFLAMMLMTIHCCRRFYETQFVSVFSESKMSIGIYVVGLLHYFGAILAIICEAPGILNKDGFVHMNYDFSLRHLSATVILLWANKTQFDAAVILGRLRKNEKGKINSTKHHIPRGKYFELISCPHYMCEIIIYLCLWVVLWGNTIWPYVTVWVILNQVECALLSHWWYQETFKNYPKERKAIIPYVL